MSDSAAKNIAQSDQTVEHVIDAETRRTFLRMIYQGIRLRTAMRACKIRWPEVSDWLNADGKFAEAYKKYSQARGERRDVLEGQDIRGRSAMAKEEIIFYRGSPVGTIWRFPG